MSKYSFAVNCKKVSTEFATENYLVEAMIEDVELDDIINEVGSNEVLDHFTHDDIAQYVIDNNVEIPND